MSANLTDAQKKRAYELFANHATALEMYLVHQGLESTAAEELVEQFLATVVSRDLLQLSPAGEPRLRFAVLALFTTWLSDEGRELAGSAGASDAYHREWAWAVVGRAMQHVRSIYEKKGKIPVFEALRGILPGGGKAPQYARVAMDFGMSEAAVEEAANALSISCAEFLRKEVAETVTDHSLVEDELQYLLALVRASQ
jgi:hypothetical protein